MSYRFVYDNNYFNDRYQGIPVGGYTQIVEKMLEGIEVRPGVDYFDIFDPMTRISSIRVLIALASIHNLMIHQMDVQIAFF